MHAGALIVIASASFVSFQSMAAVSTFYCRAKVVEATGSDLQAGVVYGASYVFDDAESTLAMTRGPTLKAQATPSAIAVKATPEPGRALTISISRATGGFVTTHTMPGSNMRAEGKCEETAGDVRKAGGGSVTGSVYSNPYFGMTITAPAGWHVMGAKETQKLATTAAAENVPVMIMVGPGAGRRAPATVALMIDERRPKLTLEDLVGILRKGSGPDGELGPVQAEPLGGRAYSSYRWITRRDGKEMWMQFYARFEKGYSLVFVTSAETEESLLEAQRLLRGMQRK